MHIDDFVSLLADLLGEPPKWQNDSVTLLIDETEIIIEYIQASGYLYLYSPLVRMAEPDIARLAPSLLTANLFAVDTGGLAALAYDAEEEWVVLWQKLHLPSITPDQLREEIMVLRSVAEQWREWFRNGQNPDADGPPDAGPLPFPNHLA